jgi:hypothetical protein
VLLAEPGEDAPDSSYGRAVVPLAESGGVEAP